MDSTPFARHDFRKSSRSDPQKDCVEIALGEEVAEVRDSKTEFGSAADGRIRVSRSAFIGLLAVVAKGHP